MKDCSFLHEMLNEHDNFVFVEIYFYIYDTEQRIKFFIFYVKCFTLNGCVPT